LAAGRGPTLTITRMTLPGTSRVSCYNNTGIRYNTRRKIIPI
jgi:hypothetical protein